MLTRGASAVMVVALPLAGCSTLPRSGPLTGDIARDDEGAALDGLVAPLTVGVAAAAKTPEPVFPAEWRAAATINPLLIGVDDRLDVVVWETQAPGVFTPTGGAATLSGLVV